jgi:hypothetical protein
MSNSEIIARARSVIGKGCRYGLGKGGMSPSAVVPWDGAMLCDCSGFIAWVLGVSRHLDHPWYKKQNGGWLETTAIVRDCATPYGFFTQVATVEALAGDLIVYGDIKKTDDTTRQGHVGLISEVGATGPARAVHCSKGNERRTGDAIFESPVGFWLAAGGIVARCALVGP